MTDQPAAPGVDALREASVKYIHDGEWARVGSLMVYPREENRPITYSIGRLDGARSYRDLEGQDYFENMQAAIDQAVWLVSEPEIMGRL